MATGPKRVDGVAENLNTYAGLIMAYLMRMDIETGQATHTAMEDLKAIAVEHCNPSYRAMRVRVLTASAPLLLDLLSKIRAELQKRFASTQGAYATIRARLLR